MAEENKVEEKVKTEAELKAEDTNNRFNSFMKEYGDLTKKYGMDIASFPTWVPDGQGSFKTIIESRVVDIKNQPQKSPFVAK